MQRQSFINFSVIRSPFQTARLIVKSNRTIDPLGGTVKFVDAVHFVKGEGIEKKQEDFAAEVAAQMNMGK